jgi:hypothetical protein
MTGCAVAQGPIEFKEASIGAVATNPDFWRRPVEVCGHVTDEKGPEGEWILTRTVSGSSHWVLVDAAAGRFRPGSEQCVRGVVRRRDGLTEAEAEAKGIFRWIVHAPNYDYVLYPCSDPASCREAVRSND